MRKYRGVTIRRTSNGWTKWSAEIGWKLLQADTLDGIKRLITNTLKGAK
ncbi:hypothetical protein UFOVP453_33 [uncultured Caudovirales phage]|uniref:Uncharacterized protein n=1 Tax=uncultured Caudovirales phage TaxID=2100421 RepID=A0A6J5MDP0_9CAUD|nr:hypothetical protein UFOVP453_33 [uncultured Caudovirales phage]